MPAKDAVQEFSKMSKSDFAQEDIRKITEACDVLYMKENNEQQVETKAFSKVRWANTYDDFYSDTLDPYQDEMEKLQVKKTAFDQFEKANMLTTLVQSESETVIQKMLGENNIDVSKKSETDFTISDVLSQNRHNPMTHLEKLIEEGLDINSVDERLDEDLLQYAARTGNL